MCKKAIFILLAFTFALAVQAHATTIMWISDAFDDDTNTIVDDKGFVDLLRANGYTVDYRGESMNTSAPDYRYWRTLNAGKIAELNAADLIIVSRCIDSGQYDDGTEPSDWNGLTPPLLLQSAQLYRGVTNVRWKWLNTNNTTNTTDNLLAVLPGHPIFNGVNLNAANEVSVVNVTTSVGDGTVDPTNNYTLIAVRATAGADGVWIASWEAGVEFYPGSGQYAGGPRLYLACGTQETTGSVGRGMYNLTAEGQNLYLNVVEYLLAFNCMASSPTPANGASAPPEGEVEGGAYMILTFEPGDGATTHTAYFSSNRDDVEGRVEDVSLGSPPFPVYMPTSYYVGLDDANLPAFAREPLQTGITYYWAVDEFDGVETYPGSVWSFIIIPEHAWDPTPPDDAQNLIGEPTLTLSWRLGSVDTTGKAVSYDVYYGTDKAAIAADTTPDAHISPTTLEIGPLDDDRDYYWKVNTVLTLANPPFTQTIAQGPVWHFKTLLSVSEVDPNLVAWWKLDGGFGDLVFDWSGHAHHGTRMGDPQDVPGHDDGAFDFDGNDYIELPTGLGSSARGSVVMWIKTAQTGSVGMLFYGTSESGNGYGTQDEFHVGIEDTARPDTPGGVTMYIMGDTTEIALNSDAVNDDEWHHVATTWDSLGDATLYTDGDSISAPHTANIFNFSAYIRLGRPEANERYYNGLLDDVRLYDIVLSERDVKILAGRLSASSPDPANGATDVSRTPALSWSPGAFVAAANGNIVYYSEDLSAVTNRTAPSATVTNPTFTVPGTLDLGTSFYWAVDTVNEPDTWPGDLWRFTTIDWLPVDNMESYVPWTQSGNHIFEKWRDAFGDCTAGNGNNTGSTLTENPTPVNGGIQSMKYDYDNDGTIYSPCSMSQEGGHLLYSKIEAQIAGLPSGIGTNWTIQGVKALSLRFYGAALNGVEPMWVQLKGGSGYGNKVTYGDYEDEDTNAVTEESWHEWFIDMADFGVNLSNVVSISIGFGNDNGTGDHGSGTIYFDDFRLYTPRCMPSRHTAELAKLDFAPLGAPDCVVNYKELDVMADDWLLTDTLETGQLLVRWQFNETSGTTATDSSGKGRHGDVNDVNGVSWVNDAERGRCLDFAGGDYVLDNDANLYLDGLRGLTVAVWVKNRETAATDKGFIIFQDPDGTDHRDIRYDAAGSSTGGTSVIKCGATIGTPTSETWQEYESASNVQTTAWQHVALTWSAGNDVKLYINGVEDTTGPIQATLVGTTIGYNRVIVGKGSKDAAASAGWNGLIDDVQIYNYALSAAEIATVKAGGAIPPKSVHYPPPSSAEIYEGEAIGSRVINFKDHAELVDNWLLEIKYPQ